MPMVFKPILNDQEVKRTEAMIEELVAIKDRIMDLPGNSIDATARYKIWTGIVNAKTGLETCLAAQKGESVHH
jgi:hypothetical protein